MQHYVTQKRINALMKGWTKENLRRLHNKMKNKGINQGGILSTSQENRALFEYLEGINRFPRN